MAEPSRFKTGLIVLDGKCCRLQPPFKGKNWSIVFQENNKRSIEKDEEISICSGTREVAQSALNLIIGCLNVLHGEPGIFPIFPADFEFLAHTEADEAKKYCEVESFDSEKKKNKRIECYNPFSVRMQTGNLPIACSMAAKASYRRKYIYAISKYNFSIKNCSLLFTELEPFESEHISPSRFPDDHIRFCHAIISAYSVIEELGLEVRASQKKPSLINGQWNPIVKDDLEKRLTKARINLEEKVLWAIRGPKRRLELKHPPRVHAKSSYAKGTVRDSELDVIDAIQYVSWLRTFIASHKTKAITPVVSVYDISNAQQLARRLLLESLNYWRDWSRFYER